MRIFLWWKNNILKVVTFSNKKKLDLKTNLFYTNDLCSSRMFTASASTTQNTQFQPCSVVLPIQTYVKKLPQKKTSDNRGLKVFNDKFFRIPDKNSHHPTSYEFHYNNLYSRIKYTYLVINYRNTFSNSVNINSNAKHSVEIQ